MTRSIPRAAAGASVSSCDELDSGMIVVYWEVGSDKTPRSSWLKSVWNTLFAR